MRVKRSRTALLLALLAMALAVFASGCGGDDEEGSATSGSNKGEGIREGTGSRTDEARASGTKAGEALGKTELDTNKTIGVISILGGIESADRIQASFEEAAKRLGYKTTACDGQGDPSKMVACGNSLLDRNVDAVATIAIDTSLIKPVIAKANQKKVPILQMAGQSGEGYDGSYYPSETEKAEVLAQELIDRLKTDVKEKPAKLALQDYPAPWAKVRTDLLKEMVKGEGDIEIVADSQTDATQLLEFTRKNVTDILAREPDVDAFWFSFDATGQAGGPVIAQKYAGKTFPDRPLITTFHADLGTQALMRKDQIDLVVDSNYDAATYMVLDALNEYWARDTEFPEDGQPEYPEVGKLFFFKTITKENLPPEGEYVETPVDVPAYFYAKWGAEFGKPAS